MSTNESLQIETPETNTDRPFTKLVLTGGPCAGKSEVSERLQEIYGERMIRVPEAATMLFEGGFPLAGRDIEYSDEWRLCAQTAIFDLQLSLEKAAEIQARQSGADIILCDRGIFDGEAYSPGLIKDKCEQMGLDYDLLQDEYDGIIHLESLAVDPDSDYGNTGNASRMEDRQEALDLNHATKSAWENVGEVTAIAPADSIDDKVSEAVRTIDGYTQPVTTNEVPA